MTDTINKLESVQSHAETIKNDELIDVSDTMEIGDEVRQGDIYIIKIQNVPLSASIAEVQESQLAPGTTQGSRHCLDSLDGVTLYSLSDATVLEGPIFVVDTGVVITHPEHGDVRLGSGCFAITYQRAYADELRRISD